MNINVNAKKTYSILFLKKNVNFNLPSVTSPFKLPYHPNSTEINSYDEKRKPLSHINNNITINLPTSTTPQEYNLNINLKIS